MVAIFSLPIPSTRYIFPLASGLLILSVKLIHIVVKVKNFDMGVYKIEIIYLSGVLAIIIFYFPSYYFIKKDPQKQKIYYLLPAIITTVCLALYIVLSFFLIKDGWMIMGGIFFSFAVISGSFIGSFLPFLYLRIINK